MDNFDDWNTYDIKPKPRQPIVVAIKGPIGWVVLKFLDGWYASWPLWDSVWYWRDLVETNTDRIEQDMIHKAINIVEALGILGPDYPDCNSPEQQNIIVNLEAALEMLGK